MSMDASDVKLMLQQQMKLMVILTERLSASSLGQPGTPDTSSMNETLANSILEFHYDPVANVTFDSWFKRYEDLFQVEFANRDDAWKVSLLVRKLGPIEHEKYVNFILPQKPRDRTFTQTVETLVANFGEQFSLFNLRYQCFKSVKRDTDDFASYASIVNNVCERFKLRSLTEDQFKCLIYICGLQSPQDAEIRIRILGQVEQNPTMTLQSITAECQRLRNLKRDSAMVQRTVPQSSYINAVSAPKTPSRSIHSGPKKPPTPCWHCGDWHYTRYCPFKQHRCKRCNRIGHKDGFCRSHQSGPPRQPRRAQFKSVGHSGSLLTSFKVDVAARRRFVSLRLNGRLVRLQLDTASDITIISTTLWNSIGRPPIEATSHVATSACGNTMHFRGQLQCCVQLDDISIPGTCYVADTNINLMGIDWVEQLGLTSLPMDSYCNLVQSASPPPSQRTNAVVKPIHEFCQQQNIQHVQSPSDHPQSNGQAERFVDTFKRDLLKASGEGTTDEVLQTFLFASRTNPNPAKPNGSYPAEASMGRKLRTTHHALISKQRTSNYTDSTRVGFSIGDPVYARDYRLHHSHWIPATTATRLGDVMYHVTVNGDTWVRHKNQLRPRSDQSTYENNIQTQLPLDLLLDTFGITNESKPALAPAISPEARRLQPRRWADRKRRNTPLLQVEPRHPRY